MSGEPGGFFDTFSYKVKGENSASVNMNSVFTDYDYVKNLGLKIISWTGFLKKVYNR